MKQFFQLLFISFGLLLVLGMNAQKSEEFSNKEAAVSTTFSFSGHQAELIPASSSNASLPHFNKCLLIPQAMCITPAQKEMIMSTGIRNRLLLFTGRFMEYNPGLLQKKGLHIFLPARKDKSVQA